MNTALSPRSTEGRRLLLEKVLPLVGTKSRYGVEFRSVVRDPKGFAKRIEVVCPCGTVWFIPPGAPFRQPIRSCLECARKRNSMYMYLLDKEVPL